MIYCYPLKHLWRDYVRSGLGLLICIPPMLWLKLALGVYVVLWMGLACFIFFLIHTLHLQITQIHLDKDHIAVRSLGYKQWSLNDLTAVHLKYFTVRSVIKRRWGTLLFKDDRESLISHQPRPHQEWYQLTLQFKKGKLKIDSHIESFDELLENIVPYIQHLNPKMNRATVDNLFELGYDIKGQPS